MSVDRRGRVEDAFRRLPERFNGAPEGFDATYRIVLADIGRTWEVRATTHGARVRPGVSRRPADVVIATDAATWLALREGELSGVEAFSQRRLSVHGHLDRAVGFEGLFRLPGGRPPLLRVHRVGAGRHELSVLTTGTGPDVLLLHGLGATKASFFDTAAALARDGYTVHAVDLPGFGFSSTRLGVRYGPRFFADTVLAAMDALGIGDAHVVGNSMGGRVALELGLDHPDRVRSLALLCPAVAFVRRGWHPLVRLLRPEFGVLPHSFGRRLVEAEFWSLFADRDLVDPVVGELAVAEFERIYRSPLSRLAFLASARSLYLETPFGPNGFYPRLAGLQPPALFVWGGADKLIPAGFERHVRQWLPGAQQVLLDGIGHMPQVEVPERTSALIQRFLVRADALGGRRSGQRLRRVA